MPFITEEVWMVSHNDSVHLQQFPQYDFSDDKRSPDELLKAADGYRKVRELLSVIRGEKTRNNFSMKKSIARLTVMDNEFFRDAETDIKNVLNVAELDFAGDALFGELVWGE